MTSVQEEEADKHSHALSTPVLSMYCTDDFSDPSVCWCKNKQKYVHLSQWMDFCRLCSATENRYDKFREKKNKNTTELVELCLDFYSSIQSVWRRVLASHFPFSLQKNNPDLLNCEGICCVQLSDFLQESVSSLAIPKHELLFC